MSLLPHLIITHNTSLFSCVCYLMSWVYNVTYYTWHLLLSCRLMRLLLLIMNITSLCYSCFLFQPTRFSIFIPTLYFNLHIYLSAATSVCTITPVFSNYTSKFLYVLPCFPSSYHIVPRLHPILHLPVLHTCTLTHLLFMIPSNITIFMTSTLLLPHTLTSHSLLHFLPSPLSLL